MSSLVVSLAPGLVDGRTVYPLCSAHYKLNVSRPQLEQSARLNHHQEAESCLTQSAGWELHANGKFTSLKPITAFPVLQLYNLQHNLILTAFSSISSKSLDVLLDLLLSWIHEEDCKCLEWTRWMEKYVKLGSYFIVYSRGDVETRFWQSFILRWDDQQNKSDAYFYHWWLADLRNLLQFHLLL